MEKKIENNSFDDLTPQPNPSLNDPNTNNQVQSNLFQPNSNFIANSNLQLQQQQYAAQYMALYQQYYQNYLSFQQNQTMSYYQMLMAQKKNAQIASFGGQNQLMTNLLQSNPHLNNDTNTTKKNFSHLLNSSVNQKSIDKDRLQNEKSQNTPRSIRDFLSKEVFKESEPVLVSNQANKVLNQSSSSNDYKQTNILGHHKKSIIQKFFDNQLSSTKTTPISNIPQTQVNKKSTKVNAFSQNVNNTYNLSNSDKNVTKDYNNNVKLSKKPFKSSKIIHKNNYDNFKKKILNSLSDSNPKDNNINTINNNDQNSLKHQPSMEISKIINLTSYSLNKKKKKKNHKFNKEFIAKDQNNMSNFNIKSNLSFLPMDDHKKQMRSQRFRNNKYANSTETSNDKHSNDNSDNLTLISNHDNQTFVGTCQDIEKSYFRLTEDAVLTPHTVRPYSILVKSLQNVAKMWNLNGDYVYACDQLKSIRQDLIVQKIENTLTLKTYEVHARLALENADLTEFNQCQHQLMILYETVGSEKDQKDTKFEFIAYFLIYCMISHSSGDILDNLSYLDKNLNDIFIQSHETLNYSLELLIAYCFCDIQKLLVLSEDAPQMSCYLVDILVESIRQKIFLSSLKIFKPNLSVQKLSQLLYLQYPEKITDFLAKFTFIKYSDQIEQCSIDCQMTLQSLHDLSLE